MSNYEASGYSAIEIGFGERPAVIVVDFQTAFTNPRYPLGNFAGIHAAVERTADLLAIARQCRVPVASCYTAYHSEREMPLWKVPTVREQFFHGHPCTEIDPRIRRDDYDYLFAKEAPSIFFNTSLTTFLTRHGIDTVIVTGCTTSGCIRASVIDSFSFGYRTIIAEDCCGDVERGPHEANLTDMRRRYADVVTAQSVASHFRAIAEPSP